VCHNPECHYAKFHYTKCHYVVSRYSECHNARGHYLRGLAFEWLLAEQLTHFYKFEGSNPAKVGAKRKLYDNDFTLIIDIYFYETFSTPNSNKQRLRFTL
jgi:hypothetical protein